MALAVSHETDVLGILSLVAIHMKMTSESLRHVRNAVVSVPVPSVIVIEKADVCCKSGKDLKSFSFERTRMLSFSFGGASAIKHRSFAEPVAPVAPRSE